MKATGKLPYFTAKRIAGVLAGEVQCLASIWIPSRFWYEKRPSDFNFAEWTLNHNALVERRRQELVASGYRVTVENQNKFDIKGSTARITGRPDLLAFKDREVLVSDAKTGQQRLRDHQQCVVYVACLPLSDLALPKAADFRAEVVYTNGVIEIPATDLTTEHLKAVFNKLKELARSDAYPTIPNEMDCMACDIAECTDRMDKTEPTSTTEF